MESTGLRRLGDSRVTLAVLALVLALAYAAIAAAPASADTVAPVTTSNAQATYPLSPARIGLHATDDSSGVLAVYYRVDGGPVLTVNNTLAGFPALGIPVAHVGGPAPTTCVCHPGIIPAGHSGGPAPATCACHTINTAVQLTLPFDHGSRQTGCAGCHQDIGVIRPSTTDNPNHYGTSPGFPGAGTCDSCHTFVLGSVHSSVSTTVSVSGDGTHTLEFWATDRAGNAETPHTVHFRIGPAGPVVRVFGADRYDTAVSISASKFGNGSCNAVVIASGEDFPDALCAAGLAGTLRCPILLARTDSVSARTLLEAHRVTAGAATPTAFIVGGENVVSANVVTQLTGAGFTVTRLSGPNRYSTAATVAARIRSIKGSGFVRRVFVVRGDLFPDAVSVGPYAYSQGMPVLLTEPTVLTSSTRLSLQGLGITDVVIGGSTHAVSAGVASAIDALPSVNTPVRQGGATRYDTQMMVSGYAILQGWGDPNYVGISSGLNFPDALAGSAVVGANHGVALLTRPSSLPHETATFITAHKGEIGRVVVFGDSSMISDSVRSAIQTLLQ